MFDHYPLFRLAAAVLRDIGPNYPRPRRPKRNKQTNKKKNFRRR